MQADHAKIGMIIFLLFFFLTYGGLHLYIFIKTKNAIPLGAKATLGLIAFMIVMVFAPVIIRLLEKGGHETAAFLFSYIGYTWTGIAFLFFSMALLIDGYRLFTGTAGLLLHRDFSAISPSAFHTFMIPLVFALAVTLYGYFEAQNVRTERLVIRTSQIPAEMGTLKIVQISDVHIGLIVHENRLDVILRKVKAENPDILVSTGDLVDGQICKLNGLIRMLKAIKPKYGKFAVTGNHEFYAGLDQAIDLMEQSGFKVLRGETVTVADAINIAGVDDPAGKIYGLSKNISEKTLLSPLSHDKFTILLKHQPTLDRESPGLFDLQLSGHTHRGQIFPFSLITRLRYPFNSGYFTLANDAHLYVSRGAGTWGPPVRFLAPPEITVIELVHPT